MNKYEVFEIVYITVTYITGRCALGRYTDSVEKTADIKN